MNDAVTLFSELGRRLVQFGGDDVLQRVIARACKANSWFTPCDVHRAVDALCCEMLQPEKLEVWLREYAVPVPCPRRVLVVAAGNIPLVGFFDLLCVVAAGHHCLLKPSGKDLVLTEYIVGLLRDIDPNVPISYYGGSEAVDAVIATGSDNTNRYFRAHYAEIPALLRGSRQSLAVLSGQETEVQLLGLMDDVFAYSGLGCRNVSLVFLPRGYEWSVEMPEVNQKYHHNYRQTKALLKMTDVPFQDLGSAVLAEGREFPVSLSRIHYTYYDVLDEVDEWIAMHDNMLQCVVTECLPHPRRVAFGRAQYPALTDYPDARDVITFLLNI